MSIRVMAGVALLAALATSMAGAQYPPPEAPRYPPAPIYAPAPSASIPAPLPPASVANSAPLRANPAPVVMAQAQLPPPGWQPTPAPPPQPSPPPQPVQEVVPAPPAETVMIVPGPELIAPCCPPPKLWEGSFQFGLNGSSGNSEVFNFRIGTNAKRKTPENELTLSLLYVNNTQDGQEIANRAFLEGRDEWLTPNSPWTRYVHGTGEYDEFRAFDCRIAVDAGWGYSFVKNPATTLIGRFGPGFSQEIGGPDDSIVPEAVLGMEFEHKFSELQKLLLNSTWYPDLSDLGEFRCNSKAAWEMLINPGWNLSLQLSVLNRYDSTPSGAKANDMDYALTLLWSF